MAVCKMCCVLTAMLRPTRKHGAEAQDKLGQQIKTQSASGAHLSSRVCLIRARDSVHARVQYQAFISQKPAFTKLRLIY